MRRSSWFILLLLFALGPAGCGGDKSSPKAVTEQLEKGFEKADASTRQGVAQVSSAWQAGDYTRAIRTMNQVTQVRPADPAQVKAVDTLILQTRQAVQQKPHLNTPELYKAMSDLVIRVHGEN